MTVESTTTIDGLDQTLPLTTDRLIEGDNHLRLLKIVVKNIFPGANGDGFNIPIIATEAQLNYLQGLTADIEAQLIDLRNGEVPVGGIQNYIGLISAIPSRFFLCNGNNGTPDLANKFIIGTATEGALGVTGGSADDMVVSHTHTANHDTQVVLIFWGSIYILCLQEGLMWDHLLVRQERHDQHHHQPLYCRQEIILTRHPCLLKISILRMLVSQQ